MTDLAIWVGALTFCGSLLLWLGGFQFGSNRQKKYLGRELDTQLALEKQAMAAEAAGLRKQWDAARNQVFELESTLKKCDAVRRSVESDMSQMSLKATQAETLAAKLQEDVVQLREANMRLTKVVRSKEQSVQFTNPSANFQASMDTILGELDLEKVAHRQTATELEMLRKQRQAENLSGTNPGEQRAKFQTAAISMRDQMVSAVEYHKLQQISLKLQQEKQELMAALEATKNRS